MSLSPWDLERELREMALSCANNQPATIKGRVRKFLKKYEGCIQNEGYVSRTFKENRLYEKAHDIMKSKRISYDGGQIPLDKIASISTEGGRIAVELITGSKHFFDTKNWEHLNKVIL